MSSSFMAHMCKRIISPGFLFTFFPNFNFRGQYGKKWPKMAKMCLPHFISQESYIMWLWFLLQICKMMISPAIVSIFSKFCFFSLTNSMLITVFVQVWPEDHQKSRDVVSLWSAEHLVGLELATFQFWLQNLNPIGYSPQIFILVRQFIGLCVCYVSLFVCVWYQIRVLAKNHIRC